MFATLSSITLHFNKIKQGISALKVATHLTIDMIFFLIYVIEI